MNYKRAAQAIAIVLLIIYFTMAFGIGFDQLIGFTEIFS